jgi:TonB family protein
MRLAEARIVIKSCQFLITMHNSPILGRSIVAKNQFRRLIRRYGRSDKCGAIIDIHRLPAPVAGIASVENERMLPATIDANPAVGWFATPISWALTDKKKLGRPSMAGLAIPRLPVYYELQVGPKFYPAAAVQHKEQGTCMVHFLVNAKGSVTETQLSKSTGLPDLDCAAVTLAEFTPAQATGEAPIEATA